MDFSSPNPCPICGNKKIRIYDLCYTTGFDFRCDKDSDDPAPCKYSVLIHEDDKSEAIRVWNEYFGAKGSGEE